MSRKQGQGAPKVGPAVAIKVMSPPPKNAVVCLPVIGGASLVWGQLRSDEMTKEEADLVVKAINGALR